jgi:hypothetical protein
MGESFGRFESTSAEIKSEIRCEQQQTMLAPHFVQKPHTPHHYHNVKTQPLCSQIRHPIKPLLPIRRSIDPSLRSRKCQMQHFKCAANYHAYCQPTTKPWSAQHQIFIHLNFVFEYHGVKAKNEGVFNWLIRKKRKEKKKKRVNISTTLRTRLIQRGMECYVQSLLGSESVRKYYLLGYLFY